MSSALRAVFFSIALLLVGSGCSSRHQGIVHPTSSSAVPAPSENPSPSSSTSETPRTQNPALNDFMKRINWCGEGNRPQTDSKESIWISSEYFNGFQHGPTIRHVCRDDRELFYLQMDWGNHAKIHAGRLFAVSSSSTKAFSSPNVDPDFKLLESDTSHPGQIRFSIDGNIGVFDETHNWFVH